MKKILLLLIALTLINCQSDDDSGYETVRIAVPVIMSKADLHAQMIKSVEEPMPLASTGKFYFYNDYIFVNDLYKGIHVIDNSDPASPAKIAFLDVPGNIDIEAKNDILYADSYGDLVTFDISNMDDIKYKGILENALQGSYYPYPEVSEPVADFDLSNFNYQEDVIVDWEYTTVRRKISPVLYYDDVASSSESFSNADGIGGSFARFKIVGDYLYVLDAGSINIFSLQNAELEKLNEVYADWSIETIFSQGDYLYIGGTRGMLIYNISEPQNPQYVSEISHITGCDPVVVDGDYAYLTLRGGNACGQDLSLLEVIDVSDKTNPQVVGDYDMQEPYGLGVHNNRLYVSDGAQGLKIFDKTDPLSLEMLSVDESVNIYDVIPLQDNLLMIGGGVLYQYSYGEEDLSLISAFTLM